MIYRLQNPLTVENFLTLAHLANSRGEITLKKFIISAYYITGAWIGRLFSTPLKSVLVAFLFLRISSISMLLIFREKLKLVKVA